MPYVNNCAVFGCPSSGIVPTSAVQFLCTSQINYGGYSSYGWNATLFNYTSLFPVKQSDIYKITATVFLADVVEVNWLSLAERTGTASDGSGVYDYKGIDWTEYPWPIPNHNTETPDACHIAYRHNGFANVCFCDGHVASLTETEITKVQPSGTRKVAYLSGTNSVGLYEGAWSTFPGLYMFPYFQVSASLKHF